MDGVVGFVPLDEEALFAAFGVIGEGPVGEAVAVDGGAVFVRGFVEEVHNAGGEEEPKSNKRGAEEDGDGLALRGWLDLGRCEVDSGEARGEHLPGVDGVAGLVEVVLAVA